MTTTKEAHKDFRAASDPSTDKDKLSRLARHPLQIVSGVVFLNDSTRQEDIVSF